MSENKYYLAKTIESNEFVSVVENVTNELNKEGFGVITEVDFKNTFKNKIGADIPKYLVLGACNPPLAYRSTQSEARVGLFLPCNVLIRELDENIEVSIVDPLIAMQGIGNDELTKVATEVREKLVNVINNL